MAIHGHDKEKAWVIVLSTAALCFVMTGPLEGRCRELEEALLKARARGELLVVVLVGGIDADVAWVKEQLACRDFKDSLGSHPRVVVPVDRYPSVALRFGVKTFPHFLVLDGESRELGRTGGKPSVDVLARRLRAIIDAANHYRAGGADLTREGCDPQELLWAATYHWNRGDRSGAVEYFSRVLEVTSAGAGANAETIGVALRHLARDQLDRGKHHEAESKFRRALALEGSEEKSHSCTLGLSMSLRRQGRVEEAISVLEELLESSPEARSAGKILFALGYLYHETGALSKAARFFDACEKISPGGLYGQRSSRYLEKRAWFKTGQHRF